MEGVRRRRGGPGRDAPSALPRFLATRPGNRVHLHPDGAAALAALERLVDAAQREVLLAVYTVADDAVGRGVDERLAAAARRGVDVKVVVDGLGSLGIAHAPFPALTAAGGRAMVFHPVAPWHPRWGWWNRDHRKLLVVDGASGLVGGMNLAEPYVAPLESGGMIDRKLELAGPAAADLARLFDRTWRDLTDDPIPRRSPVEPHADGVPVAVEGNGRIRDRHRIGRAYREAIRSARRSIRLENPYFLPGPGLRRHLRNAVKRGVAVQVVLPERTDARLVDLASRAVWGRLAQAGIDLRIDPAFVHAKMAVFDDERTIIGSFNLDRRSLFHNLEAVAFVADPAFAAEAAAAMAVDAARAQPFDLARWRRRPALERWAQHALFGLRALL